MGRSLVILGLVVVGIGLVVMAGVPLGRLPGDIIWRRGQTTVYLPIVTCLVISVVLSLILSIFRR
jgi:predicted MFS family arabinose efflux permease